jgi:PAS domain S-box-containing protein
MDYVFQDRRTSLQDETSRPATMNDLLDVIAQSRQPLLAMALPDTTVVAANNAAALLFGETTDTLIGRRVTSLYCGADEVHASIALSAMASGAIDSYRAERRIGTRNGNTAWVSVRRFDLQELAVAVQMSLPIDQRSPLDGVEQEFAKATGIAWFARPLMHRPTGPEGDQQRNNYGTLATLDRLPLRQRQIVAALLQGDRTPAIAASLFVSNSTVRSHLSSIFAAFGVRSQTELLSLLRHRPTDRRSPRAER